MHVRTLSARFSLVGIIALLLGACAPSAAAPAAAPAASPAAAAPVAATPAAAGQPKSGGTLRYGIVNDPSTMDPHKFSGAAADVVYGMVYNSLVKYKPDWSSVDGDLAESWDVRDNSIYTFKL